MLLENMYLYVIIFTISLFISYGVARFYRFHKKTIRVALLTIFITIFFISIIHFTNTKNNLDKYFKNKSSVNSLSNTQKNNTNKKTSTTKGTVLSGCAKVGEESDFSGPLDGLSPSEMSDRLNYLYQTSCNPKENKSYVEYQTGSDKQLNSLGSLENKLNSLGEVQTNEQNLDIIKKDTARWYPSNTLRQTNYRDCTNFPAGHPDSCLQYNNIPFNSQISQNNDNLNDNKSLDNNNNLEKNNKIIYEGFENKFESQPHLLNGLNLPNLFKNAPGDVNNRERDITNDLCRGCKVGVCFAGICGSQLIESGNENIIDVNGYIQDFSYDKASPMEYSS
jgi:hypothetical protein